MYGRVRVVVQRAPLERVNGEVFVRAQLFSYRCAAFCSCDVRACCSVRASETTLVAAWSIVRAFMTLALIMVWYASIGGLAAVGAMYLSHRFLPARHEATLYGLFLSAIAGFYLVCTGYFGDSAAWGLEGGAVVAFAVMGCLGTRVPLVLMAGYALHGGWDLLHEIQAHVRVEVFGGQDATRVPLAYGTFCAVFDWAMVAYFVFRHRQWLAAWKSRA
jgi:hypothetical protein